MSQSVTIKSNKYGINLVLDPEIGFDELLKDVVEKFKASSTFFKNAKLALSFEGRKLSEEEEQLLTDNYLCSNIMHANGHSILRLIAPQRPHPDAVQTAPNMEDLYLHIFGK